MGTAVAGIRYMGATGTPQLLNDKASDFGLIAGEIALDGSNPTPLTTPFKRVLAVYALIKRNASAVAGAGQVSALTYDVAANVVNFYGWNTTATADANGIASTATATISYIVIGEV